MEGSTKVPDKSEANEQDDKSSGKEHTAEPDIVHTSSGTRKRCKLVLGLFKCRYCPLVFHRQGQIAVHIKIVHPEEYQKQKETTPTCTKCNKIFVTWNDLEKHRQEFCSNFYRKERPEDLTKEEPVEREKIVEAAVAELSAKQNSGGVCEVCQIPFSTKASLTIHMKQKHPNEYEAKLREQCTCIQCGNEFPSRKILYEHSYYCDNNQEKEPEAKKQCVETASDPPA